MCELQYRPLPRPGKSPNQTAKWGRRCHIFKRWPTNRGVTTEHPTQRDYEHVLLAERRANLLRCERTRDLNTIPDEPLPAPIRNGVLDSDAYFNFIPAKLYGLRKWGDLFTNRQLVTICAAARFVNSYPDSEVKELLALALDRCIDCWVSFARWKADAECPVKCLARQAIPMVWDFAEANPLSRSTRSLIGQVGRIADAIRSTMFNAETGIVEIADAKSIPLPDECASIWFT